MAPPRVSWARLCTGTAKASESGSPASPFGGRRRPGSSHMDPIRTGGSHTVSTTSTEPVGSAPAEASESTMLGPVPLVPLGRPQVAAAARLAEHGLRHPVQLAGAGLRLGRELASVARGATIRTPAKGDRRFSDPTWLENPLYRRLLQGYLATTAVAGDTVR